MRELKYRAWDKKEKVMFIDIQNIYVGESNNHNENNIKSIKDFIENDNFILMQYTGFKDQNGRRIYEGDIVEFIDNHYFNDAEFICRGEVIFDEGTWHVTSSISISELFCYDGVGIEVIGNVFQNPDLLESD